jgi:hypothetical protein
MPANNSQKIITADLYQNLVGKKIPECVPEGA